MADVQDHEENIEFETHPSRYRHWALEVEGDRALLRMRVQEDKGLRPDDYVLKLNSYDLGVDIELADVVQRLRFEHPEVRVLVLTGTLDRVFCAGANILMLRTSTHGFKVNFCKFTNETRLYLEDLSASSGIRTLAALNGTASGGGYELALAADKILLVDDRSSAVSFPETPLLGVLPGTGGLTRLVDKRMIRRDRADVFSTLAEGIKGKRALEWDLVDAIAPLSRFDEEVSRMASELAETAPDKTGRVGIELEALAPDVDDAGIRYRHIEVKFDRGARRADLTLTVPADAKSPATADEAHEMGTSWWLFRMFRELDHALVQLRILHNDISVVGVHTRGDMLAVLAADEALANLADDWFVNEIRHHVKRTLKRYDNTAKSLYAIADQDSCYAGTFIELLIGADRSFVLNDPDHPVTMAVSAMNDGPYPMANGLTRLQTRFLGDPSRAAEVAAQKEPFDAERADELGLCTAAPDELDWEDELRVAFEERASFSPDALTGMEANLRFAGPETMETKIFGRLSAWQNWIFQRPNAAGERGALTCYGTPDRPEFDFRRT